MQTVKRECCDNHTHAVRNTGIWHISTVILYTYVSKRLALVWIDTCSHMYLGIDRQLNNIFSCLTLDMAQIVWIVYSIITFLVSTQLIVYQGSNWQWGLSDWFSSHCSIGIIASLISFLFPFPFFSLFLLQSLVQLPSPHSLLEGHIEPLQEMCEGEAQ